MKKLVSLLLVLTLTLALFSSVIVYADDNTVVVDGVTFSKNMQILVKYPADKTDESYTIPDSVTFIANKAFYQNEYPYENKFLKNIIIPGSVKTIGDYAFAGRKSLTSVTIPDGVTSIGAWAFQGCTSLTSVSIPDSVTSIGYYAFSGCTSLTSVTIPDGVTSIDETFEGCTSLTSVSIPDSVTSIGSSTFAGCTALTSVSIPDSVTSIGIWTFARCTALTSVTIPDGVTIIDNAVFSGCTSLTSVTIPDSVTIIYDSAFEGCTALTDVYYGATEIEWNSIEIGTGNEFLQIANIHFTEPAKSEIKVTLYGKKLSFDQPPVVENGRTLVPLRAIFEALDAEVAWDGETQTVRAIRYGTYIELQIGSNEMKVNNEVKYLDVPAKTINDRTMVPARAVAEAFGCNVSWDAENNAVIIN